MENFKHSVPIQMRFNDVDQMGHVNNAVIMEYFDLGKSAYFKAAGVPVTPEEGNFTVMIVHYEVDFVGQIRYGDELQVRSKTVRFGNKSFNLLQQVVDKDGEVKVECRIVMAGYDRAAGQSAVIPEEIKQKVSRFENS